MHTRQTDLARLLMGTKVFVVPQFQRHYKWKQAQWFDLYEDILEQYEAEGAHASQGQNEGHFLGSVVLHPAPGPASTVARYWVIDGQQRLTTLMVLIAAIRDFRSKVDDAWNPASYTDQYLVNPYNDEDRHKLVPGDNDRGDFVSTVYEGAPKGSIGAAYRWFMNALAQTHSSEEIDFKRLESAVLLRLILVELNTSADDNINQIFHTINHAGMKLTAIDLIRNHTFMQFPHAEAAAVHTELWRPMERRLGDEKAVLRYFWAQLVRTNPKATQRDLYGPYYEHLNAARRRRPAANPGEIIRGQLTQWLDEVDVFRAIESPYLAMAGDWSKPLQKALADLATWGSQTYLPIALELLSRLEQGRASDDQVARSLQYILSFFVRRGLAGIPTNNLNRILSVLPSSMRDDQPVDAAIRDALGSGSKYWPTDREVRERVVSTPLYLTLQTNQVKFILAELERSSSGVETLPLDQLTVEHVMPQAPSGEWLDDLREAGFDAEVALSRVHVLGNLTATGFNQELGRRPFTAKRELLAQSNLQLNRQLANVARWTPTEIDARSGLLAEVAMTIWRRPSMTVEPAPPAVELMPNSFDLPTVMASLPADVAVRYADIGALTSASDSAIDEAARQAGYSLRMAADEGALVVTSPTNDEPGQEEVPLLALSEIISSVQAVGSVPDGEAV